MSSASVPSRAQQPTAPWGVKQGYLLSPGFGSFPQYHLTPSPLVWPFYISSPLQILFLKEILSCLGPEESCIYRVKPTNTLIWTALSFVRKFLVTWGRQLMNAPWFPDLPYWEQDHALPGQVSRDYLLRLSLSKAFRLKEMPFKALNVSVHFHRGLKSNSIDSASL